MGTFSADDWITISVCPEESEMTIWVTLVPYDPLVMELSVSSNGNH
jgi:hypothetical protein